MEFLIEQDSNNPVRFYAAPIDEIEVGGEFMRNLLGGLKAGMPPSEATKATRRVTAEKVAGAFKQTQAYAWLSKCPERTVTFGGQIEQGPAKIPRSRIWITFADRGMAAKFKMHFV